MNYQDYKEIFLSLWTTHKARLLGVIIGLLIGILFLTLGFWRTLFLVICMTIGYLIGQKIDHQEDLIEALSKYLPRKYY